MPANGSQPGIPQHQIGLFKCPTCGEGVFEILNGCQFAFDKLKPEEMKPIPRKLFRCLGCKGFLAPPTKDHGWIVVSREEHVAGDEWKGGGIVEDET